MGEGLVRRGLWALLLAALGAGTDDVQLRVEVDAHKIGLKDSVQLSVTLEGHSLSLAQEIALPPLKNLRLIGGPSVSTQISVVNGSMSQSRVYTYVLQGLEVGPAEIGSVHARLEGGEKVAPPVPLEVVPGSVQPPRSEPAESPLDSFFGTSRPQRTPKILVRASLSRSRLHVGEPLVLTYFVYTQATVTDLQFGDAPRYPGFWSEDMPRPETTPEGEARTLEGDTYHRFPVFQKLLFPTRAGRLTIPASSVRLGIAGGGFFDSPSVVQRTTEPLAVDVDPIPEEPGFSGAVGRFQASAALDRSAVSLGDAVTLRFKVEGRGNLKWIDHGPDVVVKGAKVYPPQVKSDFKAGPEGFTGSKSWEYVVVPETTGALEIPSLVFSSFDPSSGRIVPAETAPLTLTVTSQASSSAAAPTASVAVPGSIALRSELERRGRGLPRLKGGGLALGLGVLLLIHAALGARGMLGSPRDRSAPHGGVRAALAALNRAGRDGLSKEASATLIEKALHDVFGPVDEGEAPEGEGGRAARAMLQDVQFLRYAPQLGDYSEKIRDIAERAKEIVRKWA
jgi:hypothetical protein